MNNGENSSKSEKEVLMIGNDSDSDLIKLVNIGLLAGSIGDKPIIIISHPANGKLTRITRAIATRILASNLDFGVDNILEKVEVSKDDKLIENKHRFGLLGRRQHYTKKAVRHTLSKNKK